MTEVKEGCVDYDIHDGVKYNLKISGWVSKISTKGFKNYRLVISGYTIGMVNDDVVIDFTKILSKLHFTLKRERDENIRLDTITASDILLACGNNLTISKPDELPEEPIGLQWTAVNTSRFDSIFLAPVDENSYVSECPEIRATWV
jgi:hypothetical protein